MNARALSQEAASWYLTHLDPFAPHRENVTAYLRGPVLALTLKILNQPKDDASGGLELESEAGGAVGQEEAAKNDSPGGGHWRSYLLRTANPNTDNILWDEQDQEAYDELGRRTKARMEAFLESCVLAIPEQHHHTNSSVRRSSLETKSSTSSNNNGSSKSQSSNASQKAETSMTLTEGLAGFTISKKQKNNSSPPLMSMPASADLLRQISSSSGPSSSKRQEQLEGSELATRLELYIRSLNRVRTLGRECVVAVEPSRAMKARAHAVVVSFVSTVGCVRSIGPALTRLLHCLTRELLAVDTLGGEVVSMIKRLALEYEHQTSFASLAFLSSPESSAETRLTPMVMKYLTYLQHNWENLVSECELERMLDTVLDHKMRHEFKTIEFQSIGHLLEVCQGFRHELQNVDLPPHMGGISSEEISSLMQDTKVVKQALRDLKREVLTVNGHILPPAKNYMELLQLLSQTLNSKSLIAAPHVVRRKSKRGSGNGGTKGASTTDASGTSDSDHFISSGNEGDSDRSGNIPRLTVSSNPRRSSRRRSSFQLGTVDMMTRRLLIASSRTGLGGDAYFVVKDLFGGEDVEVVPSSSMPTYGRMSRATIEILVRLASVTIKCHGSFDVYPKALVGDCEPLIQVHTTTTEVIGLQEVRASDSAGEDGNGKSDESDDEEASRFVLKEQETPRTGWRTLSIRPALYEKVGVWNTPS